MAAGKRHTKPQRHQPQLRSRTTRSSKGRLLTDPETNTQELTAQLRALGLYAAPTIGDGNCLFRALADQLYGSPSQHAQLRADVCDWIAAHKSRYEPFVEDERGLDVHLRCMRENGTYGGHLELSAFAHLMRRNVKVIQPGLVYVIEWAAGGDPAADATPSASTSSSGAKPDSRADRHTRRDRRPPADKPPEPDGDEQDGDTGTIYVAYHDWEHFSSIRSLRGPHTGLPGVREMPAPAELAPPPPVEKPISKVRVGKEKEKEKEKGSVKLRIPAAKPAEDNTREKEKAAEKQTEAPLAHPPRPVSSLHPSLIAMHMASSSSSSLSPSSASTTSSAPADNVHTHTRTTRSPKRAFAESDASSCASTTSQRAKRTRNTPSSSHSASTSIPTNRTSTRVTRSTTYTSTTTTTTTATTSSSRLRASTRTCASTIPLPLSPPPSPPFSSSSASSTSGSSSTSPVSSALSSPQSSPSPPPEPAPRTRRAGRVEQSGEREKPLTRRQRKVLGLPKPRAGGLGKIVIPGGRYALRSAGNAVEGNGEGEEWARNGTGRVDVRGFRELRI
ncbi:hypothetical protein BD779DRAFT_1532876 [Infundibulicybe gibba]|nr:hypothetical protein BD779DRAFT_1532876 [Infundibulicybe gibba]